VEEDLTGEIIGAAIEVHRRLGPGFLESIYENALMLELGKRNLTALRQVEIRVMYDGIEVGKHRLDILVENQVIVELKAVRTLEDLFFATVRSYLRAANKPHGLLLNFGKPTLEIKRIYPGS
jgi:GxxExxY protein